jgi:hypothetical protein
MKKSDVIAYLNRWDVVQKIEREEMLSRTMQQRWLQLNSLFGLAVELKLFENIGNTDEEAVWQRWAELRNNRE